jgi:S-DNA-T family DNA segregation ATPase FtsK/SpoIIIE
MDSRIVLDMNGAETLLGQGDMLFLPPGASKPIRAQGTFIDDKEIRDSVKLVKRMAEAQYEPELVQIRAAGTWTRRPRRTSCSTTPCASCWKPSAAASRCSSVA